MQCHGSLDPPEDPANAECTEQINGFDNLRNWWSPNNNIWEHHAIVVDNKIIEGWVQAVVPSGLPGGDAVRLYCTVPLPQTFAISIDSGPPGIGKRWRLCWKNSAGGAFAVEVRGPEEEPPEGELWCYNYRVIDISCVGAEAVDPVILDGRVIPFYFLGDFGPLILTMSVCINETKNLIIVNAGTYSESFSEELQHNYGVRWNFAHHLHYTEADNGECERQFHCYPSWIEVPHEAPGTYEWGGDWTVFKESHYNGAFAIGKARGEPKQDVIGTCECKEVGLPLFVDDFNRENENIPTPFDSTEHLWPATGAWSIFFGNYLKTTIPAGGSASTHGVIRIVDHHTGTSPDFVLHGWDLPFAFSMQMKLPAEAQAMLFISGEGYGVLLKTSDALESIPGKLQIRKSETTDLLGTELASIDIPIVQPALWHTVKLCWNGEMLVATLIASLTVGGEVEYSVMYAASDVGDSSYAVLAVPSQDSGNPAGEYLFNYFSVSASTDFTIEPTPGTGIDDDCGCCGPFGCEGRYLEELIKFPPLAGQVDSCFWEHTAEVDGGFYTYLGSYSGQRGSKYPETSCELDDTIRIEFGFQATTAVGEIEVAVGGNWAKILFSDVGFGDASTLEISSNPVKLMIEKIEDEDTGIVSLCLGMGSFKVSVRKTLFGAADGLEGTIGIPQDTMAQPEIHYKEADITSVEITHGLYDPNCESCYAPSIVPCEDMEKANCVDGEVVPTTAHLTFDHDYENDPCCDDLVADMATEVLLKPLGSAPMTLGADCCDAPLSEPNQQCIYTWVGGGRSCEPPAFSNYDRFTIRVRLQKYDDGYRLCGELEHAGSDGGSVSGVLSGISDVIADEAIDCSVPISGSIPLTCYLQVGPGFDNPFCGLSNVVISVG
jgi:hypothetical protein